MTSLKRPAYQWYPGDWRRDTALQSCSFEARAMWREMLDLMHDGEPYGHLTAGGVPITAAQLARIIGVPARRVASWMTELEDRKVFSRDAVGVIYSRRMVRDEHVRNARAAGGRTSLRNPNVPRPKHEEGYPSDHPSGDPNADPSDHPLQFASASALQKPTTATAGARDVRAELPEQYQADLDTALLTCPRGPALVAELQALHDDTHATGTAFSWAEIGLALHDYVANGAHDRFNVRQLRRYADSARQSLQTNGHGPPNRTLEQQLGRKLTPGEQMYANAKIGQVTR